MTKRILFVFRHPPYGTAIAREGLEALLAAAVYEQDIAALFINDGIFQLLEQQNTDATKAKNHARMLTALPLYGVDQVYVNGTSLETRGVSLDEILLNPVVLSDAQTHDLLASFDQLLSF